MKQLTENSPIKIDPEPVNFRAMGLMKADWNEIWGVTEIMLGMGSTNERRRYLVTPPLIDWAHTQNEPIPRMSPYPEWSFWLWASPMREQSFTNTANIQNVAVLQQIGLYEIIGGMLSMCQNTTMRVNGAWIKRYCVLCSKTINTLHSCHKFPDGSRQAARGTRICETSLIGYAYIYVSRPQWVNPYVTRYFFPKSIIDPECSVK